MINKTIICVILVAISLTISLANVSAEEAINRDEPSLGLEEALTLAKEYIKDHKIDISKHYLDNIRLLSKSNWMEGKHWILTWRLKGRYVGGEIFIIVGMDKKIIDIGGL